MYLKQLTVFLLILCCQMVFFSPANVVSLYPLPHLKAEELNT